MKRHFLSFLFLNALYATSALACPAPSGMIASDDAMIRFKTSTGKPPGLLTLTSSSTSDGSTNVEGAVIYDTTNKQLKLCDGTAWVPLSASTNAAGAAGQIQFKGTDGKLAADARLIWDTTDRKLRINTAASGSHAISLVIDLGGGGAGDNTRSIASSWSAHGTKPNFVGHRIDFGLLDANLKTSPFIAFRTSPVKGTPGNLDETVEHMRIIHNGNIGMGTSEPASILHLATPMRMNSSAAVTTLTLSGDYQSAGDHKIGSIAMKRLFDPTGVAAAIDFWRAGSASEGIITFSTNTGTEGTGKQPSERMRIDASGAIGIGNTAPSHVLDVAVASGVGTNPPRTMRVGNTHGELYIGNGTAVVNAYMPIFYGKASTDLPTILLGETLNDTGTRAAVEIMGRLGTNSDLTTRPVLEVFNRNTSLLIVGANGNVGIGTTTPEDKLSVHGMAKFSFTGENGIRILTPNVNMKIYEDQSPAEQFLNFRTYSGAGIAMGPSESSALVVRHDNARVGIGTRTPSHILHVSGVARSTQSTFDTTSDARVKTDVRPIDNGLDMVMRLKPVHFRYADNYIKDNVGLEGKKRGFIAQEVESVAPEMVRQIAETVDGKVIEDFRVLNNSDFVPLLVSAIQEMKAAHDAEIKALRAEIEALKQAK